MATKKGSKKTSKQSSTAASKNIVKTLQGAMFPCSDEWTLNIPAGMELSEPLATKTGGKTIKLKLSEGVSGKIHLDPAKLLSHKADFKLERTKK